MNRLFLPMVAAALVGAAATSVFFAASGGSGGRGAIARKVVSPVTGSTAGGIREVSSTTPTGLSA